MGRRNGGKHSQSLTTHFDRSVHNPTLRDDTPQLLPLVDPRNEKSVVFAGEISVITELLKLGNDDSLSESTTPVCTCIVCASSSAR